MWKGTKEMMGHHGTHLSCFIAPLFQILPASRLYKSNGATQCFSSWPHPFSYPTYRNDSIAVRFADITAYYTLQSIMVKFTATTVIAVALLVTSSTAQQPAGYRYTRSISSTDSYLALREHFETQLGRELDPFEARDVAYLAERNWEA